MAFTVTTTKNKLKSSTTVAYDEGYSRYKEERETEYNYKMRSVVNDSYSLIAAKILCGEAARFDLLKSDVSLHKKLKKQWGKIYNSLSELTFKGKLNYVDVFSVLGLWFPDLPSPASSRRYEALCFIGNELLKDRDVSRYLRAFDQLTMKDTRRPYINLMKLHDTQECRINEIADVLTCFKTLSPDLNYTDYVLESRAIRQNLTLKLLGKRPFF